MLNHIPPITITALAFVLKEGKQTQYVVVIHRVIADESVRVGFISLNLKEAWFGFRLALDKAGAPAMGSRVSQRPDCGL